MKQLTVKDKIIEIQRYMFLKIPAVIRENPDMDYGMYLLSCRIPLDFQLITTLVGADLVISKKKNSNSLNFHYNIPTKMELDSIIEWNNSFLENIEEPFLNDFEQDVNSLADDMKVLRKETACGTFKKSHVLNLKKVTTEIIKNYTFGYKGYPALSVECFNEKDLRYIAQYGKMLKKKDKVETGVIIGVSLAAGVGLGLGASMLFDKPKPSTSIVVYDEPDNDIETNETEDEDIPNVALD